MNPKVLIVDDIQDLLDILTQVFEKAGAKVTESTNGQHALEILEGAMKTEAPFDLVVVDIRMPDMDGFEVAKRIRKMKYEGPIIAFTAAATGLGRSESDSAGITTYLSKKTLSVDLVRALLNEHCS